MQEDELRENNAMQMLVILSERMALVSEWQRWVIER
jgi:hypothetical protein